MSASATFTNDDVKSLANKLSKWGKDLPQAEKELLEYLTTLAEDFEYQFQEPLREIRLDKNIADATEACLQIFVNSKLRGKNPMWVRTSPPG